jgi:hypothetical protein
MNDSKPEAQADYRVETCAPMDLTAAELERCTSIVIEGEAIENSESVKTWLPQSLVLAVVRKGEEIVGVGAIKPARPRYAERVAAASEYIFATDLRELGYIARDPPSQEQQTFTAHRRGIVGATWPGTDLATTSSAAIKAALTDAGFRHQGREWERPRGRLSLWLTE